MTLLIILLGCTAAQPEPSDDQHSPHNDHEDSREIELSPQAVVAARLIATPAQLGALSPQLTLAARVTLDPRKEALVSAWISGQMDSISVRAGDTVRQGQTLGAVQSPELGAGIAAYRAALARDQAADARLERLGRLQSDGVSSRSQLLEAEAEHAEAAGALEAAEERLRILGVDPSDGDPHSGEHYVSRVPVRSPIAGKVLAAPASIGRQVQPGDPLFHVGDLSEVWLLVDLYERDLSSVAIGQSLRFTVQAWPGEPFTGRVDHVGDWIEPQSRTVELRAVVPNPDGRLKPNMFATATLSVPDAQAPQGVLLPAAAVQSIEGAPSVFIQEEEGHYQVRTVTVAARSDAQVLLSEGIQPGEQVVTQGAFTLKSELEKAELGEGHAH